MKERLLKIAEAAKASLREAEALKTLQAEALAQLDKDLDDLMKRFR